MIIEKIADTQQLKDSIEESANNASAPLAIFQEDISNIFLVERVGPDAVKLARELSDKFGGIFICIGETDLSTSLESRMPEDTEKLVAVGSSGLVTANRLAAKIKKPVTQQKVETLKFESSRVKRELKADSLSVSGQVILVDDVVVSGRTLEVATSAIEPSPTSAAVGMFFDSPDTYLRLANAGIRIVASGLRYRGERASMVPPVNTLSTLLENPDRIMALNSKYFYGQKWRTIQYALRELEEATK